MRLTLVLVIALSLSGAAAQQQDEPTRIWLADGLPQAITETLDPLFEDDAYTRTTDISEANLAVDFEQPGTAISAQWIYAPVVSFASVAEGLRWDDVERYWAGEVDALNYLTPDGVPPTFVASTEILRAMLLLLGDPADDVPITFVDSTADISTALWDGRPNAWSIMGFDQIQNTLKVLAVDRISVFEDDLNTDNYPFTVHIAVKGDTEQLGQTMESLLAMGTWPSTNRDESKLARIVLTGVTALTRATAFEMERRGITSPADGLMAFFEDAHLLHTSNEVSFSENCGDPDPYGGVIFCSKEEYLELLTYMGLDVVELTGNHVNDYGPGAFRNTLTIYEENNIATFGGGWTVEDARDAYITEVNGNSIAFIGCNIPGPTGAWASEDREGAAQCDDAFLDAEIPRLAEEVDIVILTFQDYEYYRYQVTEPQLERFERYGGLGADVVIGSQAHHPHGFTLMDNGAFLHHGLGNLFFDQMQNIGTRQMFADKLIVYDGELINVVLFTGLIENFCCPRPMTIPERANFLDVIFQASGW